jgi:subtilisin family serine protease
MRAVVIAFAAAALAAAMPATVQADRFAIGVRPGADTTALRAELERRTGAPVRSLAPLPVFVATARTARTFRSLRGVRYVERDRLRRLVFTPNDPLLPRQWYVTQNRAYDAWDVIPVLAPVRVAVIDSGVDAGHPELERRIVGARSFVGGSPKIDVQGHGTFVAGLIAAEVDNQTGIAGLAPAAELLVAKVVAPDGTIPVSAEVAAIRWAVASGARVINMSLGGLRDPLDPERDTFSHEEADALRYAISQGVVVVAAVGNSLPSGQTPWRYASWPAALPHVLGVSAIARDGSSPSFSNRDAVYNDIAAPGQDILSTFPRALTAKRPSCNEQGYSPCGPEEYRLAEGTSFAAPQVSAAAATLIASRPDLQADQVTAILEGTAVDSNAASGCPTCPLGRDAFTGWGRLDVTAALAVLNGPLPPADRYEPNDDAGNQGVSLWGPRPRVEATLDFWNDQNDVYRVRLRKGQRVYASLQGPRGSDPILALWKPGTRSVDDLRRVYKRAKVSRRSGPTDFIGYRARRDGWFYLQVKLPTAAGGAYRLSLVKLGARAARR